MKDLTYSDLVKIIPLEKVMREELLSNYESYSEDKQFEVMRILWEGFDQVYDQIKVAAEERLTQEIASGARQVEGEVHDMLEKDVWEQIEKRLKTNPEDEESIKNIRGKLQQLITVKH